MKKTSTPYTPPKHYTDEELTQSYKDDLLCDIEHTGRQALNGPFYPEKGITAESLLAYVQKCRAELDTLNKEEKIRIDSYGVPYVYMPSL